MRHIRVQELPVIAMLSVEMCELRCRLARSSGQVTGQSWSAAAKMRIVWMRRRRWHSDRGRGPQPTVMAASCHKLPRNQESDFSGIPFLDETAGANQVVTEFT